MPASSWQKHLFLWESKVLRFRKSFSGHYQIRSSTCLNEMISVMIFVFPRTTGLRSRSHELNSQGTSSRLIANPPRRSTSSGTSGGLGYLVSCAWKWGLNQPKQRKAPLVEFTTYQLKTLRAKSLVSNIQVNL